MASVLCVLRCTLLFLYFGARYVVEAAIPFGIAEPCFDDAYAASLIDWIAILLNGVDQVLIYMKKRKLPVLVGLILRPWRTTLFGGYWSLFRLVCSKLDRDCLWSALSSFISFTRVSTGRGALEKPRTQLAWSCGVRGRVARGAPWIIRFAILRLAILRLQAHSPFRNEEVVVWIDERHFGHGERLIHLQDERAWNAGGTPYRDDHDTNERGFTAVIPRCYDGDTCNGVHWHYDGLPLPHIFQQLNIRVLGIDAPELRTAKCSLERCLAERARSEMERIVGAGNGRRVQLYDCKHDKYGGRLTCDIAAVDGGSAADEMLLTGLAVSYHGKKKTTSWGDLQPQSGALRAHVAACQYH